MVRRRFISKGSTTIIDGLDKSCAEDIILFQRMSRLDVALNKEMKHLWSRLPKKSKNELQGYSKLSGKMIAVEDELEQQRWLNEIKEAEEYELIIECDDNHPLKNECEMDESKLVPNDRVFKNSNKDLVSFGEISRTSPWNNNDKVFECDDNLLLSAHQVEPTTSTPIRMVHPALRQQDIFVHAGYTNLSPIILERENSVFNVAKKWEVEPTAGSLYELKAASTEQSSVIEQTEKSFQLLSTAFVSAQKTTDETTEEQKSLPELTILNSPRQWGLGDAEHACENVGASMSVQYDRSLSLCDGAGDNRPFYLDGFPWTARYAKRRDYKRELFHLCDQKNIQTWRTEKLVLDLSNSIKLGEGTYGEVFLVKYKEEIVALKVIPIGGTKLINGGRQKSFRDIAAELIVSKELSGLNEAEEGNLTESFIRLKGALVVKGSYPKSLVAAWEQFDKRFNSENDHPRIFDSTQQFLLLAFEDGGIDLEKYKIANTLQAYSIVYQVVLALCVAEYRLAFEHRDLHCGNILIKTIKSKAFVRGIFNGRKVNIQTHGAEVKIIDFTLSRMSKGTSTIFYDFAKDDDLFTGEGCLQYDIYRAMRQANKNNWFPFCPVTNVMWLIYVVRYIYDRLDESKIGSLEQRNEFIHHFKNLHRYAGLSEWLIENAGRKDDIIRINES